MQYSGRKLDKNFSCSGVVHFLGAIRGIELILGQSEKTAMSVLSIVHFSGLGLEDLGDTCTALLTELTQLSFISVVGFSQKAWLFRLMVYMIAFQEAHTIASVFQPRLSATPASIFPPRPSSICKVSYIILFLTYRTSLLDVTVDLPPPPTLFVHHHHSLFLRSNSAPPDARV